MKATAQTQAHLKLCLDELTQKHGKDKLQEHRHQVTYVTDQFKAFIFNVWYALPQVDRKAITHNQGDPLKDAHLDTLLAKALKEYRE